MTYQQLLTDLHDTDPQPNPEYWQIILNNPKVILLEISMKNQHIVSTQLKMDRMRLSHIMPILRELASKDI